MSTEVTQFINTYIVPLGWKLIGALVVWIIGGWIISLLVKALDKAMQRRNIDATLDKYAEGASKGRAAHPAGDRHFQPAGN